MSTRTTAVFVAVILSVGPTEASAVMIRVPDDQPTIQAAIDASADGDIVEIADGWVDLTDLT